MSAPKRGLGRGLAALLGERAPEVLSANAADVAAGEEAGLGRGLIDRLRLDDARITGMASQIGLLAATPFPPAQQPVRELPGDKRADPLGPHDALRPRRR